MKTKVFWAVCVMAFAVITFSGCKKFKSQVYPIKDTPYEVFTALMENKVTRGLRDTSGREIIPAVYDDILMNRVGKYFVGATGIEKKSFKYYDNDGLIFNEEFQSESFKSGALSLKNDKGKFVYLTATKAKFGPCHDIVVTPEEIFCAAEENGQVLFNVCNRKNDQILQQKFLQIMIVKQKKVGEYYFLCKVAEKAPWELYSSEGKLVKKLKEPTVKKLMQDAQKLFKTDYWVSPNPAISIGRIVDIKRYTI